MTLPWAGRDDGEIEAIVIDRYLDSLLARHPAPIDGVDADLEATAIRLMRDLPRLHPSFVFEERLAERLRARAVELRRAAPGRASPRRATAVGIESSASPVLRPLPAAAVATDDAGTSRTVIVGTSDDPRRGPITARPVVRPVVIGGVLTSAAISLAGAAFVAWRLSRPSTDPMGRAVRAIARARIA